MKTKLFFKAAVCLFVIHTSNTFATLPYHNKKHFHNQKIPLCKEYVLEQSIKMKKVKKDIKKKNLERVKDLIIAFSNTSEDLFEVTIAKNTKELSKSKKSL